MESIYSILDKTSINFNELEELTYNEKVESTLFVKILILQNRVYNIYRIFLVDGDNFYIKVVM